MQDLSPSELAARPELRIVDIREPHERQPPVGYIPSSRLFPMSRIEADPQVLLQSLSVTAPVIVTCMTGRRSAELVPELLRLGFRSVYNLEGGILAWTAAGLPVAGQSPRALEPGEAPSTLDDVLAAMESCFVAAAVVSDLDRGELREDFNPRAFADSLLQDELRQGAGLQALESALDHLAEEARLRGHPLDRIAENLDHMRALLDALPPGEDT